MPSTSVGPSTLTSGQKTGALSRFDCATSVHVLVVAPVLSNCDLSSPAIQPGLGRRNFVMWRAVARISVAMGTPRALASAHLEGALRRGTPSKQDRCSCHAYEISPFWEQSGGPAICSPPAAESARRQPYI
ncbi:hypothetical protein MRX96_038003 [Rhipicephalus microplus]